MTNGETPIYGLREPICTLTHFAALLWAIYAALILWRMCRGEPLKQRCVGCFGLSMVLLFAASSLYHAVIAPPHVVNTLRRIDMSMVYILIAGTFTPVMGILPAGRQRTAMAVVLWGLAGVGIAIRWFLPGDGFELNVALYLLMGWLGLWPLAVVSRLIGARAVSLAVVGGLLYTAGAVCDVVRWPVIMPGYIECHQVLHVLGFMGAVCHFAFVAMFIVPYRPSAVMAEEEAGELGVEG